jgi:hypothetical protein
MLFVLHFWGGFEKSFEEGPRAISVGIFGQCTQYIE